MSNGPDFDEIVGGETTGEERERLRRAHDLLVAAGPPPELSPEIASGPTLAMTLDRRPRRGGRRLTLLAAAVAALAVAFLGGYIVGDRGGGTNVSGARILQLRGTSAAPDALASLRVEPADPAGNWPMTLNVTGLPKLPARGYYEVFLVRTGEPPAPCGTFHVAGEKHGTTVTLNVPYELHRADSWIVTKQLPGGPEPGRAVLRPTTQ